MMHGFLLQGCAPIRYNMDIAINERRNYAR